MIINNKLAFLLLVLLVLLLSSKLHVLIVTIILDWKELHLQLYYLGSGSICNSSGELQLLGSQQATEKQMFALHLVRRNRKGENEQRDTTWQLKTFILAIG